MFLERASLAFLTTLVVLVFIKPILCLYFDKNLHFLKDRIIFRIDD